MERELKTLKLLSGKKARIVVYFTRGEIKDIEKAKWQGATVEQIEADKVVIKNIPVSQKLIQDDALVLNGLKEVIDGEKVIKPITQQIIDNLDNNDFNLILTELTEVIAGKKKIEKN